MLGSASDWPQVEPAAVVLKEWGIAFEVVVASAHRAPKRVQAYAREAAARGIKVIIAVAGMAAHLAGVLAAETTLPVIGVPMPGSHLNGLDSLLSTVQMPAGRARGHHGRGRGRGQKRRHLCRPDPGPG